MRPAFLRSVSLFLAALALPATVAAADVLRVVASDARGVTLRLSTEAWSLAAPGPDGRARVIGVPDAHSLADPGHALLPAYSAMLALPPDARPTARVLTAAAPIVREGVRLAIAGRPVFRPGESGSFEPGMEAVTALQDGAWPREPVLLGTVNSFRGRKLVGIEVRPFSYDEAALTLRAIPEITVRVDFNRPAGAAALPASVMAPDPHADDVLRSSVLNFDQAAPWRVAPAGSAGAAPLFARPGAGRAGAQAFDESQPEVRVTVDSTGVWLLPYDELAANGYPSGIPIAQVSVHRHEFIEGATSPPYATYDIPVEVEDLNTNGVFDSGDRIWAYLRRWTDRTNPSQYQRWWGDADAFYATVKPTGGARMASRQGWRGAASPNQLTSYPQFQHWEGNYEQIMSVINAATDTTLDLYHWTKQDLYYDRQDTIQFAMNSIDTTHTVQFTTNWVGRAYGPHDQWSAAKNRLGQLTTVVDSLVWYDKIAATGTNALHGSAFSEGLNRFVAWGKAGPGAPDPVNNFIDNAALNSFEATYWRRFDAVHDVLDFNSADASGEIQVHLNGFLADTVRAYDVTDPENPVRLIVDESHITRTNVLAMDLQDSVAAGARRHYVVVAAQDPLDPNYGPHVPAADHIARVTRQQLYQQTACDYLMIVPEAFLPAVQPLVTLRQSLGLQVVVATAEDVYDEFNGGRHSASAIRRFAKYAYNRWNTRFMLLVGDGTLDPTNHVKRTGPDWIPINPVPAPVRISEGYEITVSDNVYGCITGNCDPITSLGDVIPELMIGRLPVNSLAETQAVVAKLVAYEDLSGDPTWRRHLLLLSDDAFSGEAFTSFGGGVSQGYCWKDYELHFVGLNQKIHSIVNRDAGLAQMNVEEFNLRYYMSGETFTVGTFGDTCRPDRFATRQRTHAGVTPVLFSRLNSGTLWWNYQGHANEYVLTHEDLYINSNDFPGGDDKFLFANTNQPVIFTAFSCHANMYARGEGGEGFGLGGCIGEDLVTLPQRGAIASWASSSFEVVPRDDSSHINVELARAMFASPPRDNQLWDHGSRVVLGEVVQAAYLKFLPTVFSYPAERGIAITYALLGDPATRVSVGRPQTLVYANDSLVIDGLPVRLHTAGDTLSLVGDLVSTARLDSVGLWMSAGGGLEIPVPATQYTLSPAFPDTASGSVYGGRRFRLSYGTHLPAQTRTFTFRAIDRDGLATTMTANFVLDATLRVDGVTIRDGDDISPVANLSVNLVSPAPLVPGSEVAITVNGNAQAFTAAPAPGDASGREWILTLTHAPFAKDNYVIDIVVRGATTLTRSFKVSTATGELKIAELFAFPNPFDNNGTAFSFQLLGSDPADVRISVYTISGRRIWSQDWKGLPPGYHQVPWDGRDAEGATLANGVFFYRLSAATPAGRHADQLGRLVKLRKPRHVDVAVTP